MLTFFEILLENTPVYHTCFTDTFIENWKKVISTTFQYPEENKFLIVKNILGTKEYSYIPLLNYTNFTYQNIESNIDYKIYNHYQIRVLNPTYKNFQKDDPVVMRIPILKRSSQDIWETVFSKNMRHQLRSIEKNSFVIQKGNSIELIDHFYTLFSKTMKKFGTPVFSKQLFLKIPEYMNSSYYVVFYENIPISAMLLLFDEQIVWCPYSGSNEKYQSLRPGHAMFWKGIQDSCDSSKLIFDFGRSAYGNQNFYFKQRWSALPVKVEIIKPTQENIYQKYKIASKIYKLLPTFITNQIGPVLCKRLPDL